MNTWNTIQLASVRVITDDLPRLVRFYAVLTGATPQYLTDDFVELVTPSATFALSSPDRAAFITETRRGPALTTRPSWNFSWRYRGSVAKLKDELGADLRVVQGPTAMPWGNVSVLIRDPEGSLINFYTPVTPDGIKLQQNRTPKMLPPSS
jgi:catechol 2,3-dioxygenase-like lactoylglutathione lyase family enzyme